jgi:hypothetical protein
MNGAVIMPSPSDPGQPLEPGHLRVTVRLKATRATVHDLALVLSVPEESATSRAAMRRYLETLQPGVFSAACTDETVDYVADAALVDVLGVEVMTDGASEEGRR